MRNLSLDASGNPPSEPLRVCILTPSLRLVGNIHLAKVGKQERRLTALLQSNKDFLAMTQVLVQDRGTCQALERHRLPFLQVNLENVEAIWPVENVD